jgi:molybdopterin-guanine dinucleotide biosynthesis protein
LRAIFERNTEDGDPIEMARRYFGGADIVIVEGFKNAPIPKIEVFRRESATTPFYDAAAANADEWVAVVTDDEKFEAPCPVLRFRDTMWLQLLANIGWEKARLL